MTSPGATRPTPSSPGKHCYTTRGDTIFTSQRLGKIKLLVLPSEISVGADASDMVVARIIPVRQFHREGTRGRTIESGRTFLSQRLVRSMGVIVLAPDIESGLLFGQSRCRWRRRFLPKCPVKAFMTAVLIRPSGRDVVGPNPELQKPHREPRKSGQAAPCGKWTAIVGANGPRQSIVSERCFKQRSNHVEGQLRHGLADKKITAKPIADRQGLTTDSIPCPEPTFEVRCPAIICLFWKYNRSRSG